MFSNNMTATSDLRLMETYPLESGDNHMTSEDLVTDTLEITEVTKIKVNFFTNLL